MPLNLSAALTARAAVFKQAGRPMLRNGLEGLLSRRKRLKKKILRHFGATKEDWDNYLWHMKHIIRDVETLSALVTLNDDEREGLRMVKEHHIPFEITPHYLSLFNEEGRSFMIGPSAHR